MLDFSFTELLLIIIVGVILLKPEDMPKIAKIIRSIISRIKAFKNEFHDIFTIPEEPKPKLKKIIGEDGKTYDAYDVEEIFKNNDDGRK